MEFYLAAFARADSIVVARGLVLTDEAGLVDPWWRWRRRRAGYNLLRTRALRIHSYKRTETGVSVIQKYAVIKAFTLCYSGHKVTLIVLCKAFNG